MRIAQKKYYFNRVTIEYRQSSCQFAALTFELLHNKRLEKVQNTRLRYRISSNIYAPALIKF